MRKFFPVEELARDSRFSQINMRQAQADPRSALVGEAAGAVGLPRGHLAQRQVFVGGRFAEASLQSVARAQQDASEADCRGGFALFARTLRVFERPALDVDGDAVGVHRRAHATQRRGLVDLDVQR